MDAKTKFGIWDKVWEFVKIKKWYVGGYMVLSLASPLKEVALPYYFGKIVEELSEDGGAKRETLWGIGGTWGASQIMFSGMEYIDSKILPEFESFIRKEFVKEIIDKYSESSTDLETGGILYELTNLPHVLGELAFEMRYRIIPAIYVLVAFTAYLFTVNKKLGVVGLGAISSFLLLLWNVGGKCNETSFKYSDDKTNLHSDIEDKLVNLQNIYSALSMNQELNDIDMLHHKSEKRHSEMILCVAKLKAILNFSYIFIFGAINGYAYYLFKKGEIEVADFSAVMIIVLYAISQLNAVSDSIPNFVHNLGLLEKIQSDLDSITIKENFTQTPEEVRNGEVIFENVSISREGVQIIKDFSYRIPDKSGVCIVGKVGSGKSTLIYALMKYLDYEGRITLGGKQRDKTTTRHTVAYIPQSPKLFNKSLFHNISYGIRENPVQLKNSILWIMKRYGLEDIFGKHSLDSSVGKSGGNVSGGQKQVISLMRVMLDHTKKVVVLDEPTSALDFLSKQKVIDMISDLCAQKTVICITHDPDVVILFPRIIEMEKISVVRT